jgi:hypothetical protein
MARFGRLWVQRLYQEYDQLLYDYSLQMEPPVLRIEPWVKRWGCWDPVTRCITLSEQLIRKHSWDVVIEVLKHEMAHQWVSEHSRTPERPHGPIFQFACRRLGVAPWAVSATGALPQRLDPWRQADVSDEEKRLLEKVEKLLSLATSSNEHEALSAMQRVREIYSRYNLRQADVGQGTDVVHLVFNTRRKKIERVEGAIFGLLVEHFSVRAIFGSLFDAQALCLYRTVEILGTKQNVTMAEYVYHFLQGQMEALYQAKRPTLAPGRAAKNSYKLGVIRGFSSKLGQSKPPPPQDLSAARTEALMVQGEQALKDYETLRHPRLSSFSWGRRQHDAESYSAGVADGDALTLHRPVQAGDQQRNRLLTG